MRIKKYIFASALAMGILFPMSLVRAHILEEDNSFGVIIHIDPSDNPVIGKQATVFFDIHDTTDRFRPEQCNCRLVVTDEDGENIFSGRTAVQRKRNTVAAFVVFPRAGEYILTLTGEPLAGSSFQPFEVEFDSDVTRTVAPPTQPVMVKKLLALLPLLGIGLYLALAVVRPKKANTERDLRV